MYKLNLIALQILALVTSLALVSCGGQPPLPEEEAKPAETKVSVSKAVIQEEPEPPTIELIPRKELEEPKIAMEPLPVDEVVEEPKTPEEKTPDPASKDSAVSDKMAATAEPVEKTKTAPEPQTVAPVGAAAKQKKPLKPVTPVAKPKTTPSTEIKTPAQKAKTPAPAPVEIPTDPNTFIVTVGIKAAPHPSLGKGHAMGFLINGVSGKRLVFERGKTYTFDVRTDPKHDVYLSRKEIGWGSTPIAEGVTGAYTYKGKMVFTPTQSTPDNVYYACRNHPNMGALIQIVNPGEKAEAVKQTATSTRSTTLPQSSDPNVLRSKVSASQVKQKLMFAEMMSKSKSSKRITASQNNEAKQLLEDAKILLSEGREKSSSGDLVEALSLADKSLKMMSEASRLVPGEEEMVQLAENYKSSLVEIRDYQKSHKTNLKRLEKTGPIPEGARYDEQKVAKKLTDAQLMADKKNYLRANAMLGDVKQVITVALHKMLDSTTITYDLNFETAADEYEYELKRFVGYEELIPIAIEAKKPAPGAIKLMESFHEKARKRRDQAVAKAAAGEYPDAIAMLQQATKTVRRALRMVGVMQ